MEEIIGARKLNSKTFQLEGRKKAIDVSIGAIHYRDDIDNEQEQWKDIDSTIVASDRPNWDYEVVKGNWHLLIKNDTTVAIGKDGHWIGFRFDGFGYLDWGTKAYEILSTRNAVTPTVNGNTIRWDNIAYGTNLVYTYQNGKFKEDLEITQTARDWLVAHPPSSYGLSNADSYLGGYALCDWQNAYPAEREDASPISWEDTTEAVDENILFRHPVKDYIVSALPLGKAYHEDYDGFNELLSIPIHSRFFKVGDDYRLLFGAKVLDLNAMPSGTIILDPTVDEQVGASTNDGYVELWGALKFYYATRNWASFGNYLFSGKQYLSSSWFRFPDVSIPTGADITTAKLAFYAYATLSANTVNTNIYTELAADPAAPSSYDNYFARDRSSVIPWDSIGAWTVDTWDVDAETPELKAIVQAVIDLPAWDQGDNAIQFFIQNDGSSNGGIVVRQAQAWDEYNDDAAKLHIEYTVGFAHSQGIMI